MYRKKLDIAARVDKEFDDIDRVDDNANDMHTKLHPKLNFTLNSINILCGKTGCGKSRTVFKLMATTKYLPDNPYHQFIYVCDEQNDRTYRKYKKTIKIPIIKIPYCQAYNRLITTIKAKELYDQINSVITPSLFAKLRPEEKEKNLEVYHNTDENDRKIALDYLSVPNFKRTGIHTAILFDDATALLTKNKNAPLRELFTRNRHHRFTYFLNVHSYKKDDIPMTLKDNIRSLWYFGGFNELNFSSYFRQFNSPIDRKELYSYYRRMSKWDVLFFDYCEDGTKIKIMKLKKDLNPYDEEEEEEEEEDEYEVEEIN